MNKRNLLIEYLVAAVLTAFATTVDSGRSCNPNPVGLPALAPQSALQQANNQANDCREK